MQRALKPFVAELTENHRLVLLGGLAIIGHGMDRMTKDADLWLEPMNSADEWVNAVLSVMKKFPQTKVACLPGWLELTGADLVENVKEVGMIRITGLGVPLDLFRKPNQIEMDEFDAVWKRSKIQPDRVALPDPLDLLRTKEETGRDHDFLDHGFLMRRVRKQQGEALTRAGTREDAEALLNEFFDYAVLEAGLENPNEEIRNLVKKEIKLLAADGDPFAKEMVEKFS